MIWQMSDAGCVSAWRHEGLRAKLVDIVCAGPWSGGCGMREQQGGADRCDACDGLYSSDIAAACLVKLDRMRVMVCIAQVLRRSCQDRMRGWSCIQFCVCSSGVGTHPTSDVV